MIDVTVALSEINTLYYCIIYDVLLYILYKPFQITITITAKMSVDQCPNSTNDKFATKTRLVPTQHLHLHIHSIAVNSIQHKSIGFSNAHTSITIQLYDAGCCEIPDRYRHSNCYMRTGSQHSRSGTIRWKSLLIDQLLEQLLQ